MLSIKTKKRWLRLWLPNAVYPTKHKRAPRAPCAPPLRRLLRDGADSQAMDTGLLSEAPLRFRGWSSTATSELRKEQRQPVAATAYQSCSLLWLQHGKIRLKKGTPVWDGAFHGNSLKGKHPWQLGDLKPTRTCSSVSGVRPPQLTPGLGDVGLDAPSRQTPLDEPPIFDAPEGPVLAHHNRPGVRGRAFYK